MDFFRHYAARVGGRQDELAGVDAAACKEGEKASWAKK
jgi:hypothetical protein